MLAVFLILANTLLNHVARRNLKKNVLCRYPYNYAVRKVLQLQSLTCNCHARHRVGVELGTNAPLSTHDREKLISTFPSATITTSWVLF